MVNGIEVLLNYLNKYKDLEVSSDNNKSVLKIIDNLIKAINDRRYIVDFEVFVKLVNKYEKTDVDNILNDIMLNVNRYNVYLMNKKIKFVSPVLDADIPLDEVKIDISDILTYLDVKEEVLDVDLVKDIKKYVDKEKFQEFAKLIKTSNDLERVLFDKIEDKNLLMSILLHSEISIVKEIVGIFKENEVNVNKVVSNIPTIFIKNLVDEKCKYQILCNYDKFISNYKLIKDYNIDFRKAIKFPIFFINDSDKNKELLDRLVEFEVKPSNVLEYAGNILVLKPEVVFNNINTLKFHGVSFTDDNNNNGYTILGMANLDTRIDYLIEKELWTNGE